MSLQKLRGQEAARCRQPQLRQEGSRGTEIFKRRRICPPPSFPVEQRKYQGVGDRLAPSSIKHGEVPGPF